MESLRTWHLLTLAVVALLGVGVVMVDSASMSLAHTTGISWKDAGFKQVVFAGLAIVAFVLASKIKLEWITTSLRESTNSLVRFIWTPAAWGMILATLFCLLVLTPLGTSVNGASRWIRFGPIQIQPSELAKWSMILWLAVWLAKPPVNLEKFWRGFVVTCAPIGFVTLLVVIEDFGTAALLGIVAFSMLLVGSVKRWHLLVSLPPVLLAGAFFVAGTPYRLARMTSFLDPWADARGQGYHMVQSLLSFASGGLTGRGLGNGVQKLGYLPEDTTDFIFAVIAEELGLMGCMLVIFLLLAIVACAWRAMNRLELSSESRLIAFGVGLTIGVQSTINIAVATVSMPTKGMSLPLVSAGGSGMIVTCAMLGLLASILRRSRSNPIENEIIAPELNLTV